MGGPLSTFVPVRTLDFDLTTLQPYVGPPTRRQDALQPTRIWSSPSGRTLVDFGQNLVGWLRFTVRGPRGQRDPDQARGSPGARRAGHPTAA